jgi:hypothetical protein
MNDKNMKEVKQYISENTKDYHFILIDTQEDEDNKYFIEKVPEKYKQIKIKY